MTPSFLRRVARRHGEARAFCPSDRADPTATAMRTCRGAHGRLSARGSSELRTALRLQAGPKRCRPRPAEKSMSQAPRGVAHSAAIKIMTHFLSDASEIRPERPARLQPGRHATAGGPWDQAGRPFVGSTHRKLQSLTQSTGGIRSWPLAHNLHADSARPVQRGVSELSTGVAGMMCRRTRRMRADRTVMKLLAAPAKEAHEHASAQTIPRPLESGSTKVTGRCHRLSARRGRRRRAGSR